MRKYALTVIIALSCWLAACGSSLPGSIQNGASGGAAVGAKWTSYERSEEFPAVAELPAALIAMRDGVRLSITVHLPADADGKAVTTPVPVILTQTGYNKSIPAIPAVNEFLVRHGYAHVSVDVRGTGNSEGQWVAFGEEEQGDYLDVMNWVATQPWSNGNVGTWGASFMAITQMFTAAHRHPAHKAVFAIVPMADAYRDIVFSGGQTNIGFIPLWLGLVTALSIVPSEPSINSLPVILEHLNSAVTNFQVPTVLESTLGLNGRNFDGEFWRTTSPIEVADRINIPTFIVGGLHDIFQRGEPVLYDAIKRNTTAKLLIGPWQHLDGSSGAGLADHGLPDLDHMALMWFDRYLRGMNTGAEAVPNVTQYLWGAERYSIAADWPHPQIAPERWYLRGDGALTAQMPAAGEASKVTVQQPLNGICSSSTSQWTAGILGFVPLPCFSDDNRLNELPVFELTYTTEPMAQDYYFNGPIQADLFASSTMPDLAVNVRVTDVAPDGASKELTNGILTASLRQVDESRSLYIGGQMLRPWHPFTEESVQAVGIGNVVPLAVEVFPTSAVIQQGHRLRVTVGPSDFPHGLPPLVDLADQVLGALTIRSDAEYPSSIVLPVVPVSAITAPLP